MKALWQIRGWKSKEEAFTKIFEQLKMDEKEIVSRGFSDEVNITIGNRILILKGKSAKKDRKKE